MIAVHILCNGPGVAVQNILRVYIIMRWCRGMDVVVQRYGCGGSMDERHGCGGERHGCGGAKAWMRW